MGCGKTSVAKALAKILKTSYLDLDDVTLSLSKRNSINEIFEQDGAQEFRALERAALTKTLQKSGQIIALGGGTLIYSPPDELKTLKILKESDKIIFLNASFETCKKRCAYSNRRPLFKDPENALDLYNTRLPLYEKMADIKIDLKNQPAKKIGLIIEDLIFDANQQAEQQG